MSKTKKTFLTFIPSYETVPPPVERRRVEMPPFFFSLPVGKIAVKVKCFNASMRVVGKPSDEEIRRIHITPQSLRSNGSFYLRGRERMPLLWQD